MDVFATLLYLGKRGWEGLITDREACYALLGERLREVGRTHGLRLLETPDNPISYAISLQGVVGESCSPEEITQLGAHLFTQGCSGVR